MSLITPESVWNLQQSLQAKVNLSTLSGSRMRENRPSGLTSGEWKRSAGTGYSGTGNRKGRSRLRHVLNTTAPLLDSTTKHGTPTRRSAGMLPA